MKIIPFTRPTIGKEEIREVVKTIASEWLISGAKVLTFEKMLSEYIGCKFVKALNSCTSALDLAVLSCGIKPGDEVITTPFTFCATVNAIIHAGAKPVFADIDKNTFNINPRTIERKITKRTKALLVMHYGGLACEMDGINAIAKKYRLRVIEDAAHAIGARYKGKTVGAIADVTCFSFHAAKNITTGEGGALTTNNRQIIEFVRKSYFHGLSKESWQRHKKGDWQYEILYPGFKYNLSDILASLGIHQLKKLDMFIEKRKKIAALYEKAFKGSPYLQLQSIPSYTRHAFHLYPIVLNTDCLTITRDRFIEKLKAKGIIPSVHFIPMYKHPAYKHLFLRRQKEELCNTEYIYNRILSLPIYPRLTSRDVEYVISVIMDIIARNRK